MSDQDHVDLIASLEAHPGPVALSGYRSTLYDATLGAWTRFDRSTIAYRNADRIESLWLNPIAAAATRQVGMKGFGS